MVETFLFLPTLTMRLLMIEYKQHTNLGFKNLSYLDDVQQYSYVEFLRGKMYTGIGVVAYLLLLF
jgi:hypothetical protein